MDRTPVSSSNLSSVGYDPSSQILEVAFRTGRLYRYLGVPLHEHQALMSAGSHGSYLAHFIKPRYRCQKVA